MANYFYLTLDTTAPSNPTILIANGVTFATQQLVDITIGTSDSITTGYQLKIWGDVDTTFDTNIQTTEVASSWITYTTSKQIKLSNGDGQKTINIRIRDDVYNISALITDTIILDTTLPIVSIVGADVPKISKNTGKNVASFSFQADCAFVEYKVKVVAAIGSTHETGTQIGTANGSTNMSGTGTFAANTPINCSIKGTDFELASTGDGQKIIKVFVKDESGQWSV